MNFYFLAALLDKLKYLFIRKKLEIHQNGKIAKLKNLQLKENLKL